MKPERLKMDTDSSSESASVPAKVSTQSKRLRRDSEHKGKRTVKSKRSNTLLSMIRDRSTSSESDNDDKKIAPGFIESRNKRKSQTSKKNHSKTKSHGFAHEETIKRGKSSTDKDSSATIRVSGKAVEQKSVLSRRNSNSERNHKLGKNRSNILRTMIDDSSDSSKEDDKIDDHSAKSLGNAKLKKKSKGTVRRIETSSDTEEEHQSSGSSPLRDIHSSVKQGKTLKGNKSRENYGKSLKREDTIKSEILSSDSDSCSNSAKSKPEVLKKNDTHAEEDGEQKSKMLLSMIHDSSDDSDSSENDDKIGDHSAKSLSNAKLERKSNATVRRIETSSDTEEEHQSLGSSSLRNIHSPAKQGKTLKGNRSQENNKSLKLEDIIKSEIPSSDSDTCSNVAKSKPEVPKKNDTHAEEDGEQKSKMLLSMIHDSSDDSDNEAKEIADISGKSLGERNLKKRVSGDRKTIKTNNKEEKRQSLNTKDVKKAVSSSKSRKTLIDYWSKPQKSEENSSETKSENFKVGGIVKSENYSVDEDSKDTSRKERKRKSQKTSAKAKSGTLLSMIEDNTSDSDRDDKRIKIEADSDDSENTTNLRRRIRFDGSDAESSDDNNGTQSLAKKPLSKRSQNFDLEVEAEDLAHLINVMEEEEMVPRESLAKLRNLDIKLQHKVPPQHMVETCAGSRGPTHEQKDIIEKFGPIKYGKYTPEEDDTIVDNWKSFCKVHDWDMRDVKPFLCMRHQYNGYIGNFSNRQKFVQYLANGLPWRTLYSVYWRFRSLYRPHLVSRYTEDEDKLIIAHMENSSSAETRNKRKFSELAKILNRTRASVWRRYRLLKRNRDLDKKPQYDLHLAKKMIKNLIQLMLVKDVSGLKDLDIPIAVWNKLSKKFGIDSKNLKQFWLAKLHMQLFCKEPIYLNDVKIKMIEYFYVSGITEWWEIEWANIAKYFDGMTSVFLCKIFSNLIREEGLEGEELSEIVKQLYEVKKPEMQEAPMDKFLPRLVFKHGSLKLLDRDRK